MRGPRAGRLSTAPLAPPAAPWRAASGWLARPSNNLRQGCRAAGGAPWGHGGAPATRWMIDNGQSPPGRSPCLFSSSTTAKCGSTANISNVCARYVGFSAAGLPSRSSECRLCSDVSADSCASVKRLPVGAGGGGRTPAWAASCGAGMHRSGSNAGLPAQSDGRGGSMGAARVNLELSGPAGAAPASNNTFSHTAAAPHQPTARSHASCCMRPGVTTPLPACPEAVCSAAATQTNAIPSPAKVQAH